MQIKTGRYVIRPMANDGQLMSTALNRPLAIGTSRFGDGMPFLQWEVDYDSDDHTVSFKQTGANTPGEAYASCSDTPENFSYVVLSDEPKRFKAEGIDGQYSFYVQDERDQKLYIGPTQASFSPRMIALREAQHRFQWDLQPID